MPIGARAGARVRMSTRYGLPESSSAWRSAARVSAVTLYCVSLDIVCASWPFIDVRSPGIKLIWQQKAYDDDVFYLLRILRIVLITVLMIVLVPRHAKAYSNPGTQTQALLEFCPRAVVFCPAAHSKHAVAPKLCWYVPWSQGVQTPPSSKVPGAHGKHA